MNSQIDPRSVFVVHGRNESLRKSMFDFLRSINLSPMEWSTAVEHTGSGSPYIGQVLDAAFDHAKAIVVLMTPDEVAYLQSQYGHGENDKETLPAPQARPNVLFEAGMALGRNADQTVLVEVGEVRPFSDVAGRHAIRLSNSADSRQTLARRLQTAGCDVNLNGTDWITTGDFTAPPPPGDGLPIGRRLPTDTSVKKVVDFDLNYINKGPNRIAKLKVINQGTETAYDVALSVPEGAALDLRSTAVKPITKVPGNGRSVTIDVLSMNDILGGPRVDNAFDVTLTAQTEAGEKISQDVFLDMNE